MSKRILFFGNERLGTGLTTSAPTLHALIAAGYDVCGVVVAQHETGNSRKARELEIVTVASEHNIPVFSPVKLTEFADQIRELNADVAVLVAYGKIVPQSVIDLFPAGIINIHPSLLPLHRGPTPVESVILNGDRETGVSLMQLAAKMDAGPVFAQITLPLTGKEIKQDLANTLLDRASDLLIEKLPSILDGSLEPAPQDDQKATYDQLIQKDAAWLDFTKPAEQLEREVRAYAGWPRSKTTLGGVEVIITEAFVTEESGTPGELHIENGQLGIYTSLWLFNASLIIPVSKQQMSAAAFLAGYKLN